MKRFACGDLVPNCAVTFSEPDMDDLLDAVEVHAAEAHDVTVTDELRSSVVDLTVTMP